MLGLATEQPLETIDGAVVSQFALSEGEAAVFVLRHLSPELGCGISVSVNEAEELFRRTIEFWQRWIAQSRYAGRWREIVHRSALALKLLTYEPTGAIVAAPTCSLPEGVGGGRNWDYRYTWIRDSAFTVYAFLRLGFLPRGRTIHALCGLYLQRTMCGRVVADHVWNRWRKHLIEETLDHLDGYMSSKPVRIGNGAYNQLQLDIYGELLDAAYLYNKHGAPISYDLWTSLRALTDWVCDNWHRKDEGVWEVRGDQREFVYSKLMCWVALDRAIRLADKRSFPARAIAGSKSVMRSTKTSFRRAGARNGRRSCSTTAVSRWMPPT